MNRFLSLAHRFRLVAFVVLLAGPGVTQVRVACLGDSITQGALLNDLEHDAYPVQLGWRLGAGYRVQNFGVGGRTLLRGADLPYMDSSAWKKLLEWQPDLVVVILGSNDTCEGKRGNWAHQTELEVDAQALIEGLRGVNPKVRVLLCSPPPMLVAAAGLSSERKQDLTQRGGRLGRIAQALMSVAGQHASARFVDLSRVLKLQQVVDGVHPNPFGAEAIANRIAEVILMPEAQPLDLLEALGARGIEPTTTRYHGFLRFDFKLAEDGPACTLVQPHRASRGRPWLWRLRFFGHQPALELELLERGFHLAYVDLAQLFGSPRALARMEALHGLLLELGFSSRPVLLGMSRGGLPLLAWGNAHPAETAALVGDNLVCDLRTWPGGHGGKRSDGDWQRVLAEYKWTEAEAAARGDFLLGGVEAPAKAGVPLLLVQGLADQVVPPLANGLRLAKLWRAAGGSVTLWPKAGQDHHPHGLHPPSPLTREIHFACGLGRNPATWAVPSAEYRGHPAGWGGETWWRQLERLRNLGREQPQAEIVFLGDSLTQGLTGAVDRIARVDGSRPIDRILGQTKALSLGLSGDRTEHLLFRIKQGALAACDPKVIVLQIGVNNINTAGHTGREVAEGIRAVVDLLAQEEPQAHVLLCGPFPVGIQPTDPRRVALEEVHASIADLGDRSGVTYFDLRPLFLDEQGKATNAMRQDGIHLSGKGEEVWLGALHPLIESLIGG
ncbi:MAG TPA: hypothetical protein EYG26_01435 [Planctomycetes bacterium]|nr:hypothetical protein [Planctomycetota bacterium]